MAYIAVFQRWDEKASNALAQSYMDVFFVIRHFGQMNVAGLKALSAEMTGKQ